MLIAFFNKKGMIFTHYVPEAMFPDVRIFDTIQN